MENNKLKLMFAFHNHQPVGNFGHVFEDSFHKCYDPLLKEIEDAENVKVAFHYSGPLIDWIEENHKHHIDRLVKLVQEGKVEILGGGYYEPILAQIPTKSAVRQLNKMKNYWKSRSGVEPQGIWLAERIWEGSLIPLLAGEGVKFTILDDYHFFCASHTEKPAHGYFVTERNGSKLGIFPTDKGMRYRIPFYQTWEVIKYFSESVRDNPALANSCLMYGDDGEKFGVWPGTYDWAVKGKWLKKFIEDVNKENSWLDFALPTDYIKNPPRDRVYLPAASYEEMLEWALPVKAQVDFMAIKEKLKKEGKEEEYRPFVKGGIWDNFLKKYRESDLMHKKMVYVSNEIESLPEGKTKEKAYAELLQSQCNCPYWHGLFGGVYLNYLRHANYNHMIQAEKIIFEKPEFKITDYDMDGHDEVVVSTEKLGVFVKPSYGASIVGLDYREKNFNILNTFTRKEEFYHKKIDTNHEQSGGTQSPHEKDNNIPEEMRKLLAYDRFNRYAFNDHIVDANVTVENLMKDEFVDYGDFVGQIFDLKNKSKTATEIDLEFERSGLIKKYKFSTKKAEFKIEYDLSKVEFTKDTRFAVNANLTLLAGNHDSRHYIINGAKPEDAIMQSEGMIDNLHTLELMDEGFKFKTEIKITKGKCKFARHPVYSISQSEQGAEANYQASALYFIFENHDKIEMTVEFKNL